MRRVLIVAYYFPPMGGAGVQRTVKFVKYLPEFGWQPVILTAKNKGAHLHDPSLEQEIPCGTPIHRSSGLVLPSWFPWRLRKFVARWLLVVDEQLGWLPFAVASGRKIIHRDRIEAIYTTSAPYTAHLVGSQLSKSCGLPWLADFRDPWIGNFSSSFPTRFHERITWQLEQRISQQAERVFVVSEPMRQALLARHPELDADRVVTCPNGYDSADFEGTEPLGRESDRWVIVYTGSFYGQRQTPFFFFQGLRTALDTGGIPRPKVRVRFVGNMGQDIQEGIRAMGLGDIVQTTGYLPHRESIGHLLGADLLLLIVGSGPGSEAVFTGKIFEYLAARKPILALTPPGVAAQLVQEAQAGVVVGTEDVVEIARQLAMLYQKWQQGELKVTASQKVIERYERRKLTGMLADVLDKVTREQ